MINFINIAENEDTLFLAIEKKKMNSDLIEEINIILSEKFLFNNLIPQVDDEEQGEIEAMLIALSDEDKNITRNEKLFIEL